MKQEKMNLATSMLIEGVNGYLETDNEEKFFELLSFANKFHNYSFNNSLLLALQGASKYVASLSKWNNMGYKINSGEKAKKVIVPYFTTFYEVDNKAIAEFIIKKMIEAGRDDLANYKETCKVVGKKVTSYGTGNVFECTQTNMPEEEYPSYFQNIKEVTDLDLDFYVEILQSKGFDVDFENMVEAKGYCIPSQKKIRLRKINNHAQNVKTLFHEVGHCLMHDGENKDISTNIKELQAESFAYLICNYLGFDTSSQSFNYIHGWTSELNAEERFNTINYVLETASAFVSELEHNKEVSSAPIN